MSMEAEFIFLRTSRILDAGQEVNPAIFQIPFVQTTPIMFTVSVNNRSSREVCERLDEMRNDLNRRVEERVPPLIRA